MSRTLTTSDHSEYLLMALFASCRCSCGETLTTGLRDPALSTQDRCPRCTGAGLQAWFKFLVETKKLAAYNLNLFVHLPVGEKAIRLSSARIRAVCKQCSHTVEVNFRSPTLEQGDGPTCPQCRIPDRQTIQSFAGIDNRETSLMALQRWHAMGKKLADNDRLIVHLVVA
jgi:hypothetical protein